jgi:predicted ATPase
MADGITRIAVEGFKSIAKRQEIGIRPLTILAGANSSGKSSIMQPLLMLKQTLEATYDPGPLKIDGPNVTFSSNDQFFSKLGSTDLMQVNLATDRIGLDVTFARHEALELQEVSYSAHGSTVTLRPEMSSREMQQAVTGDLKQRLASEYSLRRHRFFLFLENPSYPGNSLTTIGYPDLGIEEIIHVPSLRGNPTRAYPATGSGPNFPGLFHHYVASTILAWQKENNCRYEDLTRDLQSTDLALDVFAHRVNDVAIEIYVQLIKERSDNIADVGVGVSQVLPVLVALRAAEAGRLVYVEEPEIHLHPHAQTKLADIFAGAAKRGVRVVAETHSSLLLRAIQTLVAKGDLDPRLVVFHWFTRDPDGITQVSSATPDANGAFGDWPEDFGDVALRSEQEYLDAVEDRLPR